MFGVRTPKPMGMSIGFREMDMDLIDVTGSKEK
jgi:hypothetical protein